MDDVTLSRTINANGAITNQYGMYELNVANSGRYTITLQADANLDNKLYNASMNQISMGTPETTTGGYTYEVYLRAGRYYLRTAFKDTDHSGVISISMKPHEHVYDEWAYYSNSEHVASCRCGAWGTATSSHIIRESEILNNKANCLDCGRLLDLNIDSALITFSAKLLVSVNGSYILPNGIVVLVDEDVDAYFDGTLSFYTQDQLPAGQ